MLEDLKDLKTRLTPEQAYKKARKMGGSDELRAVACKEPEWTYYYAKDVEEEPNLETYKAVVRNDKYRKLYENALGVPKINVIPIEDEKLTSEDELEILFKHPKEFREPCEKLKKAYADPLGKPEEVLDPLSPEQAYYRAAILGGSDSLRMIACIEPRWAYYYALEVDKAPREDTRTSACSDPVWAYYYAKGVDKIPRNDTYLAVLGYINQKHYEMVLGIPKKTKEPKELTPEQAYLLAKEDEIDTEKLRDIVCGDSVYAYKYARDIDPDSHTKLRKAACKDPRIAYDYATFIDGFPLEETRRGACADPEIALAYAKDVDGDSSELTRDSASADPQQAFLYALRVDDFPHNITRQGACKCPRIAYKYALLIDGCFHEDTYEAVLSSEYLNEYINAFLKTKTKVIPFEACLKTIIPQRAVNIEGFIEELRKNIDYFEHLLDN